MTQKIRIYLILTFTFLAMLSCDETPVEPVSNKIVLSTLPDPFIIPFGGLSPGDYFVYVSSSSDDEISFEFSNNSDWLNIYNSRNTNFGTTPDTFLLDINISFPTMLDFGIYYDTVTLESNNADNAPLAFEVVLQIGTEIRSTPDKMEFIGSFQGSNPDDQYLAITSTAGIDFSFTLSTTSTWLTIPMDTINTIDADSILVSVSTTGLDKGVYRDTIWVTTYSALNTPHPISIQLTVASWTEQENDISQGPFNNLNDVYFTDAMNGWAVGDVSDFLTQSGYIIKTIDGGDTWVNVYFDPDTSSLLGGVAFIGSEGWVIGSSQIVLYSSDGGVNWTPQTTPAGDSIDFKAVYFLTADSGWIVGNYGTILHTSDGGTTWNQQTSPVTQSLSDVSFVDNLHGWISGLKDVILVTSDGGQTWTKQPVQTHPAVIDNYDFQEISFTSLTNGWAVGKFGLFVSTTDGGSTWTPTQIPNVGGLLSVCFVDDSYGWISGQGGAVYHTTDGGTTWNAQFIETTNSLNAVYFINRTHGWTVGGEGIIFYTSSSGN